MNIISTVFKAGILVAGASIATPGIAQVVGACMLETANGEPVNIGTCRVLFAGCSDGQCRTSFLWDADQFVTEITGGSALGVREGTAMNGQDAYAPAALVKSDPRDCIYNAVTDGLFCFVEGVEAQAAAMNTPGARAMLIEIAANGGAEAPPKGKKKSKETDSTAVDPLLANLQGKYRPVPSWDCGEIGRDGGATAIVGNKLESLETTCELTNGQAVGSFGAALFQASCTGEGDTWQDEYILQRDEWGSLAVLRTDAVSLWQACE